MFNRWIRYVAMVIAVALTLGLGGMFGSARTVEYTASGAEIVAEATMHPSLGEYITKVLDGSAAMAQSGSEFPITIPIDVEGMIEEGGTQLGLALGAVLALAVGIIIAIAAVKWFRRHAAR